MAWSTAGSRGRPRRDLARGAARLSDIVCASAVGIGPLHLNDSVQEFILLELPTWHGLMEDPSTYRGGLNIADSVAWLLRQLAERLSGHGATGLRLRRSRRGLPAAGRGAVRSIVATSDVRAQARYYAAGMVARLPSTRLPPAPETPSRPATWPPCRSTTHRRSM